jgi:hypothetical protein
LPMTAFSNSMSFSIIERADFRSATLYIVPTMMVQQAIDEARSYWVAGVGRDGKPHKDSLRQVLWLCERDQHPYYGFKRKWSPHRNNWNQLRDTGRRSLYMRGRRMVCRNLKSPSTLLGPA